MPPSRMALKRYSVYLSPNSEMSLNAISGTLSKSWKWEEEITRCPFSGVIGSRGYVILFSYISWLYL
jgi:hypothetical protein